MIAIEDQLRRYATDVAGPPVAAPPADLAEGGGRQPHRGRWLLVAALAIFVVGLTAVFAASRATDDSEAPPVATQPSSVHPITTRGGSAGPCGDGRGVAVEGTAGRGLCIEVSAPSQEGKRAIWFVVDGNRLGGHEIDPCIPVIQDGTLRVVGGESTGPMFFETSEGVESISLVSGGLEVDLATFELPDVPGRRFAAASVPDSVIQVQQHGRGGSEFRPDGSMTAVPISCAH